MSEQCGGHRARLGQMCIGHPRSCSGQNCAGQCHFGRSGAARRRARVGRKFVGCSRARSGWRSAIRCGLFLVENERADVGLVSDRIGAEQCRSVVIKPV